LSGVTGAPAWEPSEGPAYVYEQLADRIEELIRAGEIPPGSRLPGEQALRQEYGVALSTVRKAMGLLRDRGLVVTRPSKGSFIVRDLPPPGNDGSVR
jgi:DNA-binding GntR family transcriptional regulator